jgi:hypothetical protein
MSEQRTTGQPAKAWSLPHRLEAARAIQQFMGDRYGSAPDDTEALMMVDAVLTAAPQGPAQDGEPGW